jgi:hypothetical protein
VDVACATSSSPFRTVSTDGHTLAELWQTAFGFHGARACLPKKIEVEAASDRERLPPNRYEECHVLERPLSGLKAFGNSDEERCSSSLAVNSAAFIDALPSMTGSSCRPRAGYAIGYNAFEDVLEVANEDCCSGKATDRHERADTSA